MGDNCQFCLQGVIEGDELIRPCPCRNAHRQCLEQWRESNKKVFSRCEICHYQYRVSRGWIGKLFVSDGASLIAEVILTMTTGMFAAAVSSACYNWLTNREYFPNTHDAALRFSFHSCFWDWVQVYIPRLSPALYFQCYVKKLYVEPIKLVKANNENVNQ